MMVSTELCVLEWRTAPIVNFYINGEFYNVLYYIITTEKRLN